MADNPFSAGYSAALDPSSRNNGTIMGFLGGVLGSPTSQQAAGSATGQALQELATLRQQGSSPQEALIKWLQTPSGQQYFTMAGPDGMKGLAEGLAATQPPAPELHNLAPGGKLFSTDKVSGKTSQIADNPKVLETPADVASFQYFAQLSGLPQQEVKRLAGLKLDPNSNKSSVESNAIDDLVEKYGLPPDLGNKLKAGLIKVLPLKNSVGQDTGAVTVVDVTSGTAQMLDPNRQGMPATNTGAPAVALPGTTPATGAPAGKLPAVKPSATEGNPAFGSKNDMALGSGPVSKTLGLATKVTEAIDPRLIIDEGAKANDRETMLNTLRSNLQSIGTIGGGLSSNKGLIEGYVKTYLDQGFFTSSPHSQVQKLIRLHETANKNIEEETARANNSTLPNEVRKNAFETIAGWERVLSSMPTYETLIEQEKAIRAGTAGAPTVSGAANTMVKAGSKAMTEGKKQIDQIEGMPKSGINIDQVPETEILSIDPRSLDKANKVKLLRRLDRMKKGAAKNAR